VSDAFVCGLLADWHLEKTVPFTAVVTAIKYTKPGDRTGIPDLSGAEAFPAARSGALTLENL